MGLPSVPRAQGPRQGSCTWGHHLGRGRLWPWPPLSRRGHWAQRWGWGTVRPYILQPLQQAAQRPWGSSEQLPSPHHSPGPAGARRGERRCTATAGSLSPTPGWATHQSLPASCPAPGPLPWHPQLCPEPGSVGDAQHGTDDPLPTLQAVPTGAQHGHWAWAPERGPPPGSGAVQASHLKSSLGSEGCPTPTRLVAAILNSYAEPSVRPSTCGIV